MLIITYMYTIKFQGRGKNSTQFPCHLVSPYFSTTSLSHRTLFVQMTHLSNVIHQITQLLWNLMRFQLLSCEAAHLHLILLSFPSSASLAGYLHLASQISVQEKLHFSEGQNQQLSLQTKDLILCLFLDCYFWEL